MSKPSFVYVIYIRTTAEKLWQALIDPELTRQYWAGTWQESDWKVGASWRIMIPDGRVADSGKIIEINPPCRLVLAWRNEFKPELHKEGYSQLTYQLEQHGDMVKLMLTHEIDWPESKLIKAVSDGWPAILSSLKSLLETGSPLKPRGVGRRTRSRWPSSSRKQIYVIYIAATPETVWQALTNPDLSQKYFHDGILEIEPKVGGDFVLRFPDGRIKGNVVEWSPPRRLSTTWTVEWLPELRELPPCLVSYDIEKSGECVKLTLTESYQWEVPDAVLTGGQSGWPAILSSLKSVLETGRPLIVKLEPPHEMMEAVRQAVATKPWLTQ